MTLVALIHQSSATERRGRGQGVGAKGQGAKRQSLLAEKLIEVHNSYEMKCFLDD